MKNFNGIYCLIILNKDELMRLTHFCYINNIVYEYRPNGKCVFFENAQTRHILQKYLNRT